MFLVCIIIHSLSGFFNYILNHKKRRYLTVFFYFCTIFFTPSNEKVFCPFYIVCTSYCRLSFFASGVNNFGKLPTITPKIADVNQWTSLSNNPVTLDKKITILGFLGEDLIHNKGNSFNLNQKIYKNYYEFKDFQFVMVAPKGTEAQAKQLLAELGAFTDTSKWNFVFATPEEIQAYYKRLNLKKDVLNSKTGTPNVYIVDKDRNLRGRKEATNYLEGYNTFYPSELNNVMMDDVKIILAEYRLALKKNNADRQI